jgi:beta-lactamase regulating signal transducer with metallopeptidase domain
MILELALRSTVILGAAWLMTRLMPRASAATRHLVWHIALLAIVAAPILSPIIPAIPLRHIPHVPVASQVLSMPDALAVPAAVRRPVESPSITGIKSAPVTLGGLFSVGTAAVTLWFAIGWLSARRQSRRAQPAPLAWQLELNNLRERMRIERQVRLGLIDEHSSPLATGLFRSAILLPRSAAAWSADRRRAVLLHELAHIKRRDCRVQLLAHIACALYWFNPLVWMAVSRLRSERERACDDEVLRFGAQASSYAAHLLDIARELRPTMRPTAALAMARPSELEGRLISVLAAGRARVPARGSRWAIAVLLFATTVAALGATSVRPTPGAAASTDQPAPYVVANDVMASADPLPEPRGKAEATLESSPDAQDRERATLALAFTSGRDVVPALLQALRDPDSQVREKAAIGLALRRDDRVVEPLIAALADPDSQVREKAAIALGTSGDPRARDALTRALQDPDSQVREKAAAGLVLFGLTR